MSERKESHLTGCARDFLECRRGAMAPVFAVTGLMLVITLGGSVDASRVLNAKQQLQDIADSGALAGATQMGTGTPTTAAQDFVNAAVSALPGKPTVTGTYSYNSTAETVTVSLQETVQTTFGAVLTPSVTTSATSTATGNMARQVKVTLGNFSSDASDLNQVYVYSIPSGMSGTTLYQWTPTLGSTPVFSNASGFTNPTTFTTTVPTGYSVGFALSNTTGGKSGYGSNCYGQAQGTNHIYYSHREDSLQSYWDYNAPSFKACTSSTWSGKISSTTSGWYDLLPCNSSDASEFPLIGGTCSSSVTYPAGDYVYYTDSNTSYKPYDPLYGTLYSRNPLKYGTTNTDCTQGDVTYDWDDNGGSSDDNDFNDAVFTVNCTKLVVQQSSIHLMK